jgi:hypothetical protein
MLPNVQLDRGIHTMSMPSKASGGRPRWRLRHPPMVWAKTWRMRRGGKCHRARPRLRATATCSVHGAPTGSTILCQRGHACPKPRGGGNVMRARGGDDLHPLVRRASGVLVRVNEAVVRGAAATGRAGPHGRAPLDSVGTGGHPGGRGAQAAPRDPPAEWAPIGAYACS